MLQNNRARARTLPMLIIVLSMLNGVAGCSRPAPDCTIVCFGDSITAQGANWGGYVTLANAMLRHACPATQSRLVAAGVSGRRVPDLERRLEADVLTRRPQVVVVYIGINDVWHTERGGGTPKPEYEAGLRRLVRRIQDAGCRVILCTPSVIGEKPAKMNRLDAMLDEYADVTRAVAAETDSLLVDLRLAFQKYLEVRNTHAAEAGILTYDGVHLNAAGNRFVAKAIAEQIVSLIPCAPAGIPAPP